MASIESILARLTSAYDNSATSNNYKLMKLAGDESDEFFLHLITAKKSHFIDEATGISLNNIGGLLQSFRTTAETDQHYRARLKTMFARYSSSGTIQDMKNIISTVLSIPASRVVVEEDFTTLNATFYLSLIYPDILAAGLTVDEIKTLINNIKGAGILVITYTTGTFECRSIGETSDPLKSYDNIAGSNPTGGTYAGVL